MMLGIDDTRKQLDKSTEMYEQFVDALDRKNTFDMDHSFTELYYEHLKMLSRCCMDDDYSDEIANVADNISLYHELSRSYTTKFHGADFHEMERKREDKLRKQRDEALELAEECLEDERELLDHLRTASEAKVSVGAAAVLGAIFGALAAKMARR